MVTVHNNINIEIVVPRKRIDAEVLKAVIKKERLIKRNLKSPTPYTTEKHSDGVGRNLSPSLNGNVNNTIKDCHLL